VYKIPLHLGMHFYYSPHMQESYLTYIFYYSLHYSSMVINTVVTMLFVLYIKTTVVFSPFFIVLFYITKKESVMHYYDII
jgi:hypothetical protein